MLSTGKQATVAQRPSWARPAWILLQLVVILLAYGMLSQWRLDGAARRTPATAATEGTSGGGAGGSEWPITSSLEEWSAAPDKLAYRPPQSSCLLEPNGECVWGGR